MFVSNFAAQASLLKTKALITIPHMEAVLVCLSRHSDLVPFAGDSLERSYLFLRSTIHTIIECPRFPGTITVEWFLLCERAVR